MINLNKFLTEIATEVEQFRIITLSEDLIIGNHYGKFVVEQVDGRDTSRLNAENYPYMNKDYTLNPDGLEDILKIEVPLKVEIEGETIEQEHSGTWMNYL